MSTLKLGQDPQTVQISVEVVSRQGPYWPGQAIVKLNGKTIAKLRGNEGIAINVSATPTVTTSTFQTEAIR